MFFCLLERSVYGYFWLKYQCEMKEKTLFLRVLLTKLLDLKLKIEWLICIFFVTKSVFKTHFFYTTFKLKRILFYWTDIFQSFWLFSFFGSISHGFSKTMNLLNTSSTRLVILLMNYQNNLLKNCSKIMFFWIFRSLICSNFDFVLYIIHFSHARGIFYEFFIMSFWSKKL